jgi:hypothetical protein
MAWRSRPLQRHLFGSGSGLIMLHAYELVLTIDRLNNFNSIHQGNTRTTKTNQKMPTHFSHVLFSTLSRARLLPLPAIGSHKPSE